MDTEKIPILLDTDIGSDIDDAVALAYLLRQRRCELLGITTVSGDVGRRAACAEVICEAAGRRDVPIHCGAAGVLLSGPGQPNVPQYGAISHRPHRMDWRCNTAVAFLRQTIRDHPGEITLLSIGPFTNIALLFALDPEIPGLLKSFVSMAGVFFGDGSAKTIKAEWNCLVDPIATAMVYSRTASLPRGPQHLSVGLDVTTRCVLNAGEVRARFAKSPLDVVREMAEVWFEDPGRLLTFHDPLAAALIFRPELCTYLNGRVEIISGIGEAGDPKSIGATVFAQSKEGETAPHRVAHGVDVDGFFREYFSVFQG